MSVGGGSSEYVLTGRVESSGVDAFTSQMAGAESSVLSFKNAVTVAGGAVAALGAGGLAASVGAFASFDQQLTQSTAIMGDVSDAMRDDLAQTAKDTAAQLGMSSDKAAESYYYLASAGLDATESMKAMPTVAEFAAAGQMDMAQATDYATDVMKAFQIPTKNMTRVTDSMTAAVTRHNQTMEGMGTAMSYVAPVAKGLGMSVEETSAAIGMLGDAGIKGSKAGTTLRQALNKLSNPTKKMQSKLSELGVSVTDSSGSMRDFTSIVADLKNAGANTADIMALFGARAGPGMQVLLEEGGNAIDKEAKKIKSMGGITKEVAEKQLDTLNKQWDIFVTKITNVAITIGSTLAPALTGLLELASGAVDWFSKINKSTDGLAGVMSLAGLAIGGVAVAIGSLVGGPLAGLAAGIAGVVAVVGTMTGRFDGAIASIKSVASSLSSLFAPAVKTAMQAAKAAISGNLSKFASLARKAFGQFRTAVVTGLSRAWTWVKTQGVALARKALTLLGTQAIAAFSFAKKNILPKVITAVQGAWLWVRTKGVALAQTALKTLGRKALAAFGFGGGGEGGGGGGGLLSKVTPAVTGAWSWVRTQGVKLGKGALAFLGRVAIKAFKFTKREILPKIRTAIKAGWGWLRTSGVALGKKALSFLVTQALNAWEWTRQNIVPPLKSGLSKAWTWLKNNAVSLAKTALGAVVSGALTAWKFVRQNVVPPVRTGLSAAWGWLKNQGVSLAKNALSTLATQGAKGLDRFKKDVVPKFRTAIEGGARWIRTGGAAKTGSALKRLGAKAQNALRAGVKTLPKPLREKLSSLTRLWKNTGGQWVRTISTTVKKMVQDWRRFSDAIDQIVTGYVMPTISKLTTFFGKHGDEIALIVGALATVVSETFRHLFTLLRGIFQAGSDILFGLWDAFGSDIIAIANFLTDTVLGAIGGFLDVLAGIIKVGLAAVKGDWDRVFQLIVGGTKDFLTGIINYLSKWIGGFVDRIARGLDNFLQMWIDLAHDLIGGSVVPDMLSDILSALTSWSLLGTIDGILRAAWKRFDKFKTDTANTVNTLKRKVVGAVNTLKNKALNKVRNLRRDAVRAFNTLKNKALKKARNLKRDAGRAISNMVDKIVNAVKKLPGKVKFWVKDMAQKAMAWLTGRKGPLSNAKKAGKKLIDGFINGIKNKAGEVGKAVKGVVEDARKKLPFSPAKEGPLSDLDKTGPALVHEFAVGIVDNAGELSDAARKAAAAARPPIPTGGVGASEVTHPLTSGVPRARAPPRRTGMNPTAEIEIDEKRLGKAIAENVETTSDRGGESGDVIVKIGEREVAAAAQSGESRLDRRDVLK